MPAIRCPNCGAQCTEADLRGEAQFVCPGCGKAIEPSAAGNSTPAPPVQHSGGDDRWSPGPPEDSANRWSAQPPLGDDSSSSESVSQSSLLPSGELVEVVPVRQPRSPLVWALIVLLLFLAALIGVIVLARSVRPWLAARRQATVDFWLPQLDHGSDQARREAAQAIVGLGPAAVCRVLDHISDDPGENKPFAFEPGAVRALSVVGPDAVPAFCEGLRSPLPKVRAAAVEVLEKMGTAGRAAYDNLLVTLDDPDRRLCCGAIDTLGYLGSGGGPAAKRLAAFVASADSVVQRHAIRALGRIGPQALDAAEPLKKAAEEDPDLVLRDLAARSLKQVEVARLAREARNQASGEMQQWLAALDGDDTPAAIAAAEAIGNLGFQGQPAAPGLALMLHHADRTRRLAAAKALGQLGLAAADFTPTLEAAAREEDAEVRAAAAKALELPGGKP